MTCSLFGVRTKGPDAGVRKAGVSRQLLRLPCVVESLVGSPLGLLRVVPSMTWVVQLGAYSGEHSRR